MVTHKIRPRLNVFMNGLRVGHLSKHPSGGLSFTYEQTWLQTPGARPISLSLPLSTKYHEGEKVYNFFDNLLPDNDITKTRIQTLFQTPSKQPFDLLSSIGNDCVGAIQLCHNEEAADVRSMHMEPLSDQQIATLLKGYQQAPLGMTRDVKDFRISIAGAQEKTALLLKDNQWYRPLGATPTSHIFKLPIGFIEQQQIDLHDSCENEWLCCKIAEAFGLPVAPAEIYHFDGVKVLVVKRFDRRMSKDGTWLMRLPQEDMCQALGYSPALKYQADGGPGIKEVMSLLLSSGQALQDRERFYQYQILFWLLAAIDGHAKNFSIFINQEGRFHLTPLYDVMSVYPLLRNGQLQKQKIKMAMALKSSTHHYHWHALQRRYFLSTAKIVQFSEQEAERILEQMLKQVDSVINRVSTQLNPFFPQSIAEPIFTGMLSCRNRLLR